MRGRFATIITGGALVLVACGSPATDSPDAAAGTEVAAVEETGEASEAPADPGTASEAADDANESGATDTGGSDVGDVDDETSAEDTDAASDGASSGAGETAADAAAPTTSAAEPAEVRPDDGCSADNTPTEPAVADGPLPSIPVRAASVPNPLPDLAVRRINCAGGWVNLKNEIPAELPLLVWFWAPH